MKRIKAQHWVLMGLLTGTFSELSAQTADPVPETPETPAPAEVEAVEPPGAASTHEAPQNVDVVNASSTVEEAKFGPSFRVDLSHNVGAKDDTDPLSVLNLTARYKFDPKVTVSATQRISKLYNVSEGEDEVQFADTSLRANYVITPEKDGPAQFGFSTAVDATLPVSEFSRDQKMVTVVGAQATATRTFGILSALVRPFYRFHVNEYKTLDDDDSGATVVRYRLGVLFDVSLALPYDLSLSASNQWIERHYEDPPYGSHVPDHDYTFDITLSYAIDKKTAIAAGYSQANRAEQLGVVDVNLFDEESTSYFVSLSREF